MKRYCLCSDISFWISDDIWILQATGQWKFCLFFAQWKSTIAKVVHRLYVFIAFCLVLSGAFSTRDTLAVETPASLATSKMLTIFRSSLFCKGFLNFSLKVRTWWNPFSRRRGNLPCSCERQSKDPGAASLRPVTRRNQATGDGPACPS